MGRYKGEADFVHGQAESIGVLLVNLGTPDAPTTSALRKYLAAFLGDPRVVETPRLIWSMIMHGYILRTRPSKSAAMYKKVWGAEGSPLLYLSVRQKDALQKSLSERMEVPVKVALAMTYGNPSIPKGLAELRDAGCSRVLVLPAYPQYSATTTASVFDAISRELQTWRRLPELRFINHYHDNPGYIAALVAQVKESEAAFGKPEKLLFSFHGIPKSCLDEGDPYYCEVSKTVRLTVEKLGLNDDEWALTFQSRVGPREWLKPYTEATLKEWGKKGVKKVAAICPGFAVDCLETLEEIAVENRDYFLAAGGEDFRYIPALNDTPEHIDALSRLIEKHVQGWTEDLASANEQDAEKTRACAVAMGASR